MYKKKRDKGYMCVRNRIEFTRVQTPSDVGCLVFRSINFCAREWHMFGSVMSVGRPILVRTEPRQNRMVNYIANNKQTNNHTIHPTIV